MTITPRHDNDNDTIFIRKLYPTPFSVKDRNLELNSAPHTYTTKGRYTVAVKVIDIFGNDTMVLVPITVG